MFSLVIKFLPSKSMAACETKRRILSYVVSHFSFSICFLSHQTLSASFTKYKPIAKTQTSSPSMRCYVYAFIKSIES